MPCDVAIPILDVRGRAKNLSIEGRSCDFLTGRDAILRAYPDRVTAILLSRGLGTNSPDAAPSYPEEVSERLRHASAASGDIVLGACVPYLPGL